MANENELRAELIRRGLLKPSIDPVFHVKPHEPRMSDDRPITLKVKKPGDGRSKAPQFGRR